MVCVHVTVNRTTERLPKQDQGTGGGLPEPRPPHRFPVPVSYGARWLRGAFERAAAEAEALVDALEVARGNISVAARILKIDRTTLYRKLRKHGLRTEA